MSRKSALVLLVVALCLPATAQKKPAPTPKATPAKTAPATEHKGYPIVELTASGSERFDADEILKATGLRVDKNVEVPLDDVKAAAQKLVDTGVFSQVSYEHVAAPDGMKVTFTLTDKDDDQFIKCDFANVVWLSEKELLIELHDRLPLFNGTVPRNGTLAEDVGNAIQAFLKERGVNAAVASERQDAVNGDSATELVIYRVADVEIKIGRFELTGASAAMQAEVDAASKQIVGLIYTRTSVQKFLDRNLRNLYLRHGYLRASFGETEIKVLPESPGAVNVGITVPVSEGGTYKWGTLKWTGNKAMLSEGLVPYLHFAPGTVVDGVQLQKDIDKLRLHYATLGYLHMRLTPNPAFDEKAGIVNYEMPIREGDLFSMGKFDVEGLTASSASKIRQAWQLREGDPFDPLYVRDFFKTFRMPEGTGYLVDEAEGEQPRSVDVTIIFCRSGDPCKPKNENHLYTPPATDDDQ